MTSDLPGGFFGVAGCRPQPVRQSAGDGGLKKTPVFVTGVLISK
jgi:hypothetical protein